MFKKNIKKENEEMTAEEARKKTAEAKEEQFRKLVNDAWGSMKYQIASGRTRVTVWTYDIMCEVVTRAMKHFENLGYRVLRSDDCITIDWSEKK